MTEEEWQVSGDLTRMLRFLDNRGSCREYRLFGCACCRRIWPWLADARSRTAVEATEQFADGHITQENLSSAHLRAAQAVELTAPKRSLAASKSAKAVASSSNDVSKLRKSIRNTAHFSMEVEFGYKRYTTPDRRAYSDLLRCVFSNPFPRITLHPSWLTSTVLALADGTYREREFDRMPILADALQDVGCDNEDILKHCRMPGDHVRGCWVVDLILSKSASIHAL